MFDHIGTYVDDIEKAKIFYTKALQPLGYELISEYPEWSVIGMGKAGKSDFWVAQREANHNVHVAFQAESKEAVSSFHAAALAAGGADNGAPGYRKEYAAGYFGAFITDPFGNNIEAVYHDPSPSE